MSQATKIKICGLSRIQDIDAVNSALPDYIGFVFAPSRRRISENVATTLKNRLDSKIKAVGVFVNENIEEVARLYELGLIDLIQLHGDESENYIEQLKASCGCRVIKAIGVGVHLPTFPKNADYLLFDTQSQVRGGSGKTFDWGLLHRFMDKPFFVAGGLTTGNVAEVIMTLNPYSVDVSSGVETDGTKDTAKIHDFVKKCRDCR